LRTPLRGEKGGWSRLPLAIGKITENAEEAMADMPICGLRNEKTHEV
jgi:hypothetical protein